MSPALRVSFFGVPHRGEDLRGLLDGGDLGPAPLLEELDTRGVVQSGRRVCPEKRREALPVGQRRRAGAVRELGIPKNSGGFFGNSQKIWRVFLGVPSGIPKKIGVLGEVFGNFGDCGNGIRNSLGFGFFFLRVLWWNFGILGMGILGIGMEMGMGISGI